MITVVTKEPTFISTTGICSTRKSFSYHKADAIVSAANSFGIMDGGSDLAIVNMLGSAIARRVKENVERFYNSELPVGSAFSLEINHPQYKWIIIAPTMRVPKNIANTDNVYQAMRAILRQMKEHGIKDVVMPILGTGYGCMREEDAARQMMMAINTMNRPPRTYNEIHQTEEILNRTKR